MATSARLGRVSQRLRSLPSDGVDSASRMVRSRALQELKADAGADRRLSGLRNGVPLRVKVTKRSTGRVVIGHIMAGPPKQRAAWFWLEEGTKAGPRRVRSTGRVFTHPGTAPKRTWSRGVDDVTPQIRREFERQWRNAVRG